MWWDSNYPFRRPVAIDIPEGGAPQGHFITVRIPAAALATKVRDDYEDIEVIYQDSTVLYREVALEDTDVLVHFKLSADLDSRSLDDYYVYYGNIDLVTPPTRPAETIDFVPMHVAYNGQNVAYTRPGDHWEEGRSSKRGARATFAFYGRDRVQIVSEVGQDQGIFEAQLDLGRWELVDLHSLTAQQQVVYDKEIDVPGYHEVRVRVTGQQNPSALDSEVNVKEFRYAKAVLANDGGEEIDDLDWVANVGGAT